MLALGLKKETADMYYTNASLPFEKDKFHLECKYYSQLQKEVIFQICPFTFIPAWSLHRLIEIFKKGINISEYLVCSNAYNEIIDNIEYEIKEGHFNKEYLEK